MDVDGQTKPVKAFGDAKRSSVGIDPPKTSPIPAAPHSPTHKATSALHFKSMTEDQLLTELRSAKNKDDAQLIMAELLKPKWTLVAGFWAVIVGIGVMVVAILAFQPY